MRRRPPGRALGWYGAWKLRSTSRPTEPDFVEQPSLRRSNAHAIVAAEVAATRAAAGLLDTGVYGRYEVSGPGAAAWLDRLLANRLPPLGRLRLAPMLSPSGNSWAI